MRARPGDRLAIPAAYRMAFGCTKPNVSEVISQIEEKSPYSNRSLPTNCLFFCSVCDISHSMRLLIIHHDSRVAGCWVFRPHHI